MSSIDADSQKRWYVIHVRPGYEKPAIEKLQALIRTEGLEDQFGDIIMPTEEVLALRNGRQKKVPHKFLSGYILIHMVMNEASMQVVRHVRNKNIRGFLRSGDQPMPLSQREVDDIFGRLHEEGKLKPDVLFQPGQVVKIMAGPFEGFSGVIEEVDYEKENRLKVSVIVFQRATSVELEFSDVKAA
jgi:transcription termination/antitermination protein NusG